MFNPMDLTGKRFLVTGASSGIGRAAAIYLSKLGAKIVVSGRNQERLQGTLDCLDGPGHDFSSFDLTNLEEIPAWFKQLAMEKSPFSGFVHCAGVHLTMPTRGMTVQSFDDVLHTNVSTAFALAKGFRQKKVNLNGGSIVFLASVMSVVGQPGVSAYCTSKSALVGLCRSLALELARENIRVNCISPGQVMTEMAKQQRQSLTKEQFDSIMAAHPLGLGQVNDVSAAIAFLLGDTGRWITGSNLFVDGGYTAQ